MHHLSNIFRVSEHSRNWIIAILLAVLVFGIFRINTLQQQVASEKNSLEKLQVDYARQGAENAKLTEWWQGSDLALKLFTGQITGDEFVEEKLKNVTELERAAWYLGREHGYTAGREGKDIKTAYTPVEYGNSREAMYGIAFFSNYLKACEELKRKCPDVSTFFEDWQIGKDVESSTGL